MSPLTTAPSTTTMTSSSKREHSILEDYDCVPQIKRRCTTTFKADIIKAHAKFSRALDDVEIQTADEASSPDYAAKLWSKKTAEQRKKVLGQAHVSAERFLRARGVWDGVAHILDRHFASSLSSQPKEGSPVHLAQPTETNAAVLDAEVADMVDTAVAQTKDETSLKTGIVTEASFSGVAKMARELVETVSLPTLKAVERENPESKGIPIRLVPNPLGFSVPNPLDDDIKPLDDILTAFPVSEPEVLCVAPPATVSVVSLCDLEVPPVSDTESARRESPVWCSDEVASLVGNHNDFFVDPLVLLA